MVKLVVCDYVERTGDRQPAGPVIVPFVCEADDLPGQAYADFRALYYMWRYGARYNFIGFMGVRKYILFSPFIVNANPSHLANWWDATKQDFDGYRAALAKWDGASILPLLATHDMIVTPPFDVSYNGDVLMDFATSRSHHDAFALRRALAHRGVETFSRRIYPYIFVTRWSVFDRFMKFAWPLAQELEPLCKGKDSINEAYKKRPMAYVLERAFSLWLENSGLYYTELPILNCWKM